MGDIQTFVGAAQQVIDMVQQVVSKETQQVALKETQQVALKETQQFVSKSQTNKYFWDGVKIGIASACLLYTIITQKQHAKETLEETHEQKN